MFAFLSCSHIKYGPKLLVVFVDYFIVMTITIDREFEFYEFFSFLKFNEFFFG